MSTTIAYNHKGGYWKTKYSFFASFMQSVGRKFFSSPSAGATVSGGRAQDLLWKHNSDDDSKRTNFYGVASGSGMSVSFNDKVSSNKIYKSFSIEGTNNISGSSINTFVVNSDNNPNKQFSIGPVKDKGGILYGHIGLSNTLLDGSNIRPVGTIFPQLAEDPADDIPAIIAVPGLVPGVLVSEVNNFSSSSPDSSVGSVADPKTKYILLGGDNKLYSMLGEEITESIASGINYSNEALGLARVYGSPFGSNQVTFFSFNDEGETVFYANSDLNISNLNQKFTLLEITPQNINGAPPRGQYAQAEIFLGTEPYEIFSLNVNYEPTDLDHSK